MESTTFIMEQSQTAQKHGQQTKIMAWIHSHIQPNESNFMSSIDVHMHRGLEGYFGDVQTIIVGISENKNPDCNIFNLTDIGRAKAKRCRSKGSHESCAYKHFFKVANCEWSEIDFEILDCFKNNDDVEMDSNSRQSDESYDEEDFETDGSEIETDNQSDSDLDQVELSGDESVEDESSGSEDEDSEVHTKSHQSDI